MGTYSQLTTHHSQKKFNKIPNVQVSDTTGDHKNYKSL
jgi:hypothetical protein